MKKLLICAIMLVFAVGVAVGASTEQFVVSGSVGQTANLTITTQNNYNNLDLGKNASETDLIVASVNELANGNSGYTVTLTTTNAFQLYNSSAETGQSYTLTYDLNGTPLVLDDTDLDGSNQVVVTDTASGTGGNGVDKDISITYSVGGVTLPAGTYTDTITLVISNKG